MLKNLFNGLFSTTTQQHPDPICLIGLGGRVKFTKTSFEHLEKELAILYKKLSDPSITESEVLLTKEKIDAIQKQSLSLVNEEIALRKQIDKLFNPKETPEHKNNWALLKS